MQKIIPKQRQLSGKQRYLHADEFYHLIHKLRGGSHVRGKKTSPPSDRDSLQRLAEGESAMPVT